MTQPSGTVTLVFTDVEGSTRLLRELGPDAYQAAMAEHRGIVRAACDPETWERASAEGRAMSLDEVAEYALSLG